VEDDEEYTSEVFDIDATIEWLSTPHGKWWPVALEASLDVAGTAGTADISDSADGAPRSLLALSRSFQRSPRSPRCG